MDGHTYDEKEINPMYLLAEIKITLTFKLFIADYNTLFCLNGYDNTERNKSQFLILKTKEK